MIKAVIFDMDGVIIDSEPLHFKAAKKTLGHYGGTLTSEVAIKFTGASEEFFWSNIVKVLKITKDYRQLMDEKSNYYYELVKKEGKIFPHVIKLLQRLHSQVILAIASSSLQEEVEFITTRFKIKDYFCILVSGDQFREAKPNPEIYLKTAELLRYAPEECLAIEDSINGIKAVKKAGMRCVAVTNTFPKEKLTEADYIISNLNEFNEDWLQ